MENEILNKLKALNKEWDDCNSRIESIKKELKPLIIERYKQLDYKEIEQSFREKIAPRKYETRACIIGTVNWLEDFKDADSDEVVTIKRCAVVKVNNEWNFGVFSLKQLINW